MPTSDCTSEETVRLRRAMRDLVALSTLPAIWAADDPEAIARSLADALLPMLDLDLLYIRLRGAGVDGLTEIVRGRRAASSGGQTREIGQELAPLLQGKNHDCFHLRDPFGDAMLRTAVARFGHSGDFGVLVAGSSRPDFPTETERLLLGVGANQTALVLQRSGAERAVHHERERLRVTLASIGDAVITTDTGGRIDSMNVVAQELTGWPLGEAKGRPLDAVFQIVNEFTRQSAENPAERALREGRVVGLANHTLLIAKDGTQRPIDDSAAPIRDAQGGVAGVVLVFRDASERRRAEDGLRERARLAELRADASAALASREPPSVVLQHCTAALVRQLDLAFARIWTIGEDQQVLVLRASAGMYTHLDGPHGRIEVGQFKIGRIATSGLPHLTNSVASDPNISDPAWAEREGLVAFAGYPLAVEGRAVGVLGMFSRAPLSEAVLDDLAPLSDAIAQFIERKRAEEALRATQQRLRFVMDSMSQKILTATPTGDVDYFNPVWTEFTGLSFEQIRDWGWTQFIHPDDVAENVRVWKRAIDTGEPFDFEHRFRRADGQYRWHVSRATAQRDAEGRIVLWIGSNTDIHDVKRLEDDLREANRRKDEFLATLAHELRNPLAPIRTGLELMRIAPDDRAMIDEVRASMESQTRQLVRLVDDLLDVSRITSGKVTLRVERMELASVVRNAIDATRELVEAFGHELTIALPAEPILLDADSTRLTQVISNLLTNAARYTKGRGRIHLAAERQGSEAVVTVTDTGIGIPAEMLERIFEMFAQVDRSLDRSQGGLGIGLSLVKRLVDLHGGSVEAHSAGLGKGSEFVVRLPAIAADAASESPRGGGQAVAAPGKLRILVVDDNRDAAMVLAMLLKTMGNETRVAHDGVEAIEVSAQFQPRIILMDIGMPRLDGYATARRIRDEPWGKNMILVALTGWGQDEDRQRTREAGFDHHFVKPVDPVMLRELLGDLRTDRNPA
jgi:PAS domain S-box-containing protein